MSIAELVNEPIEIILNGRKLKIQRMSLREIFAPIQQKIISEYDQNVKTIAESLKGNDKIMYLVAATKDRPAKAELDRLAFEYISSPTGQAELLMVGLNKCQPISELEVSDLILKSATNPEEIAYIQSYLTGEDVEVVKKKLKETLAEEQKIKA